MNPRPEDDVSDRERLVAAIEALEDDDPTAALAILRQWLRTVKDDPPEQDTER